MFVLHLAGSKFYTKLLPCFETLDCIVLVSLLCVSLRFTRRRQKAVGQGMRFNNRPIVFHAVTVLAIVIVRLAASILFYFYSASGKLSIAIAEQSLELTNHVLWVLVELIMLVQLAKFGRPQCDGKSRMMNRIRSLPREMSDAQLDR